jgi:hypothetical protein
VSDPRARKPSEIGGAADVEEDRACEDGWHSEDPSFLLGDCFSLVREPENPIDPSAIAVHNSCGKRLGYLMPEQSAFLAPFIDSLPINMVGRVLSLTEPDDDVELVPSRPEVITSVFLHPCLILGTSAADDRFVRRPTDDIRAFDL